eukprot:NODE_3138_length_825_cov_3.227273.p1 GENE.NODE_3138_length_825_cov_3.227273~~NODE_3138_length_825_cov_3.227273.p1  ORF type:complete len:242 (+),score=60.32 NODE_3138_length_825_cov_3.227273:3-728(+)
MGFYFGNALGFDWAGLWTIHPILAGVLGYEFLLCWYGMLYPDAIGYYLSHRYWAGNWHFGLFLIKRSEAVRDKLKRVKTFAPDPFALSHAPRMIDEFFYKTFAYVWLATYNAKCHPRLVNEALASCGGKVDDYKILQLAGYCCGEFRDTLYVEQMLPAMQEIIEFNKGECFMLCVMSFGMCDQSVPWRVIDMKTGPVASGRLTREAVARMQPMPSHCTDLNVMPTLDCTGNSGLDSPLMAA